MITTTPTPCDMSCTKQAQTENPDIGKTPSFGEPENGLSRRPPATPPAGAPLPHRAKGNRPREARRGPRNQVRAMRGSCPHARNAWKIRGATGYGSHPKEQWRLPARSGLTAAGRANPRHSLGSSPQRSGPAVVSRQREITGLLTPAIRLESDEREVRNSRANSPAPG